MRRCLMGDSVSETATVAQVAAALIASDAPTISGGSKAMGVQKRGPNRYEAFTYVPRPSASPARDRSATSAPTRSAATPSKPSRTPSAPCAASRPRTR
jgi:hypothetical protein